MQFRIDALRLLVTAAVLALLANQLVAASVHVHGRAGFGTSAPALRAADPPSPPEQSLRHTALSCQLCTSRTELEGQVVGAFQGLAGSAAPLKRRLVLSLRETRLGWLLTSDRLARGPPALS